MFLRTVRILAFVCGIAALAWPAQAQQTGSISGKAADNSGGVLPGVTVEARADVLPGPRTTVTGVQRYQLPALPRWQLQITFTLSGCRR